MDRILAIFCFLAALGIVILAFPEGIVTVLAVLILATVVIVLLRQNTEKYKLLIRIFLVGLLLRLGFGIFLHVFDLREFFGADALTYDFYGQQIVNTWFNIIPSDDPVSQRAFSTGTPGWGMNYLVGILYAITGRNILAAQSLCGVIGAATAPMIYVCAQKIFKNSRVSQTAAILVAVFPAFVIWSGQLLKDGLIIFLLVLAMTMVLQLQEKFSYYTLIFLIFAIFGILALRFYIFYIVAISVAGSFLIGRTGSFKSVVRGFIALAVLGIALTYLGVFRTATENFDKWGSLEKVQRSRSDLARSADSGFGSDADVSTTDGAIAVLPIGFTYLIFAPFPWQFGSLRQSFTIPEMFIWWCSIPFLITGLIYTIKHRLRSAIAILIFTFMLTIAYSIFQGNVGTAYRQRTQIQVFLFMFIAVGWELRREKRENQKHMDAVRKARLNKFLQENKV